MAKKRRRRKDYAVYDQEDNLLMVGNIDEIMEMTGLAESGVRACITRGHGGYFICAVENEEDIKDE